MRLHICAHFVTCLATHWLLTAFAAGQICPQNFGIFGDSDSGQVEMTARVCVDRLRNDCLCQHIPMEDCEVLEDTQNDTAVDGILAADAVRSEPGAAKAGVCHKISFTSTPSRLWTGYTDTIDVSGDSVSVHQSETFCDPDRTGVPAWVQASTEVDGSYSRTYDFTLVSPALIRVERFFLTRHLNHSGASHIEWSVTDLDTGTVCFFREMTASTTGESDSENDMYAFRLPRGDYRFDFLYSIGDNPTTPADEDPLSTSATYDSTGPCSPDEECIKVSQGNSCDPSINPTLDPGDCGDPANKIDEWGVTLRIANCPEDINADGSIDNADQNYVYYGWGCPFGSPCVGDVNCDGAVDVTDWLDVLGTWGPCVPQCGGSDCVLNFTICEEFDCTVDNFCQLPNFEQYGNQQGAISDVISATADGTHADDFTATGTGNVSLTEICWWGLYDSGCHVDNGQDIVDDFRIRVYNDAGGLPGSIVFELSGLQVEKELAEGVVSGPGKPLFKYRAVVPAQTLSAGTRYWVEIRNNTYDGAETCRWRWAWNDEPAAANVCAFKPSTMTSYDRRRCSNLAYCLNFDFVIPSDSCSDCNMNGIEDSFDISSGTSQDCNTNGIPDLCDIYIFMTSPDTNGNNIPDECEGP